MQSVGMPAELARSVALTSTNAAKRAGTAAVDVAKRIGPKRALIGLAVVGAFVGATIAALRYLRARDEARDDLEAEAADGTNDDATGFQADGVSRPHKQSRAQRKHARAMAH